MEQINFAILQKLKCVVAEPTTMKECGYIFPYDKQFERLTAKTSKPLERVGQDIRMYNVTASEDPMLKKFAEEDAGVVFATDQVLSVLMSSPRSVYSWDIVATKMDDGKIF